MREKIHGTSWSFSWQVTQWRDVFIKRCIPLCTQSAHGWQVHGGDIIQLCGHFSNSTLAHANIWCWDGIPCCITEHDTPVSHVVSETPHSSFNHSSLHSDHFNRHVWHTYHTLSLNKYDRCSIYCCSICWNIWYHCSFCSNLSANSWSNHMVVLGAVACSFVYWNKTTATLYSMIQSNMTPQTRAFKTTRVGSKPCCLKKMHIYKLHRGGKVLRYILLYRHLMYMSNSFSIYSNSKQKGLKLVPAGRQRS